MRQLLRTFSVGFGRLGRSARHGLALLAVLGAPVGGCGPADAQVPAASPFPTWDGKAALLFDDSIDPRALGLSTDQGTSGDVHFRDRAQTAEVVARVRVQTFTVESDGQSARYRLGFQVGDPPFVRPAFPDTNLDVVVPKGSPAYGLVKQYDATLRGRSFIGFFSRFRGAGAEPVLHFHLSQDSKEVAAAVKEAVALKEVSGP